MEGPAGVLRCPAPGTLVQRLTDHIQSGASPLGNNVQNPAQRLALLLHPGGSLQPSLPAPTPGVVSSSIKVCESSNLELTHPMVVASSADTLRRCVKHIAEGGTNERDLRNERRWPFDPGDCPGAGRVPQHGAPVPLPAQGQVLKSPEAMRPRPPPPRGSKLDPYAEHIDRRMGEGLENCRVLDREVRALVPQGSYSTVAQYVRPRRQHKQPEATMRFETAPGKLAQVDWGSLPEDRSQPLPLQPCMGGKTLSVPPALALSEALNQSQGARRR